MSYTEFFCNASAGSNVNAGDLAANGIVQATNGSWSTITNIYTAAALTPFSGVSVGDFAAIMLDGGTVAAMIARVTAVGGGGLTLTLSTTARSGTLVTTTPGVTCTTGGAWKGPNAAVNFPYGFITNALTNTAGNPFRVNMKNNATYNITASITHANNGPGDFEGYTTAVGDGGIAVVDGGTTGASYNLFNTTGTNVMFRNIIAGNNGSTGTTGGWSTGQECMYLGCVVHDVKGPGFNITASNGVFAFCEAYLCNTSNTVAKAGFLVTSGTTLIRCISHDNSGSNGHGYMCTSTPSITLDHCIADTNGANGFTIQTNLTALLTECDAYNNTGDGIQVAAGAAPATIYIENCNLCKNGGWGINPTTADLVIINNCGFGNGAGGQGNSSGQVSTANINTQVFGSITYAVGANPWVDAPNGNFTINLAAAKNTGAGNFTQTQASYTGTVGHPDIGAAPHLDAGAISSISAIITAATWIESEST